MYAPASYTEMCHDAYASVRDALRDGKKLIEVEFPAIPGEDADYKAASDVYAPVSGEVLEVNESLSDDPSQVNSSPFEGGWMMKVKVSGGGDDLMDAGAYTAHCEAGGH